MKITVGDIAACEPINKFLTALTEKGFVSEESKVGDFHFNELYFLLSSKKNVNGMEDLVIENIERLSSYTYYCKCHWSVVELKYISC